MMVQARAEATRYAVLRAGAVVFNREGFARATTADIIREAAVSKGSMQFHFPTKEKLAQAVVAEYSQEFGPAFDAVSNQGGNGMTAAMELSALIARQLTEEPFVGAAYRLTMEESAFAPRVTKPYVNVMQVFEGLFRQALAAGELRPGVDVEDLARYLVASFIGVQFVSNTLTSRTDLIQRVAQMWTFLLPTITESRCLQQHVKRARSIFVSHYVKSRSDLSTE
ncbi:TetR/AcrR family transcriptional regulator [Arthrobacter sp. CDRTa11]|uniref:ScbR family autoregulator-binding transcription factor n=1 Tax=Arthrobacter sp. CDRTa11 TaxID=2651199 RepID=UPI002265F4D7|nr:ScbR family autoregulator-binding transcription factor [Arthrobacter sp. CDRTa11]UZX02125.1 TetR/AcrR family transcriptional regulator [Arthrobacter sp. CDRTa11]